MGGKISNLPPKTNKEDLKWLKKSKTCKLQTSAESLPSSTGWTCSWSSWYQHHGIHKEFNVRTADQAGMIIQLLSQYTKTNHLLLPKTPPAAVLGAAGVEKVSGTPNKTKVATVNAQVQEIAETKMPGFERSKH